MINGNRHQKGFTYVIRKAAPTRSGSGSETLNIEPQYQLKFKCHGATQCSNTATA